MGKPKRVKRRPPAPSRCRDCDHTQTVPRWRYFTAGAPRCSACGGMLDYLGGWQGSRPARDSARPAKIARVETRPADVAKPKPPEPGLTKAEKSAARRAEGQDSREQKTCLLCDENLAPVGATLCRPCQKHLGPLA